MTLNQLKPTRFRMADLYSKENVRSTISKRELMAAPKRLSSACRKNLPASSKSFPGLDISSTFDRELSKEHTWRLLYGYIEEVERTRRCPLAALIVQEFKWSGLGRPGSGFHFHLLLRAPAHISARWLKELWALPRYGGSWCRQRAIKPCDCGKCEGGAMRVCRYNCNGNAAKYLFKEVETNPDGWQLHREHLLGLSPQRWHTSSRLRKSVHRYNRREDSAERQHNYKATDGNCCGGKAM